MRPNRKNIKGFHETEKIGQAQRPDCENFRRVKGGLQRPLLVQTCELLWIGRKSGRKWQKVLRSRIRFQLTDHLGMILVCVDTCAFTGTDRGLLRSVLGPWFSRFQTRGTWGPISMQEHTSMEPRPRRQSQNPPLQKSFAIPALPSPRKPRLRYPLGLAPTTRLNALLNAASDS